MRISIFLIYFVVIVQDVSSQVKRDETMMKCLDEIFNVKNFDSLYYSHLNTRPHTFFVIENEHSDKLGKSDEFFELGNGSMIAITNKSNLFIFQLSYYIEFLKIELGEIKSKFIFKISEYNGIIDKELERREIYLECKEGAWRIIKEKIK